MGARYKILLRLLSVAGVIGVWEGLVKLTEVPGYLVPPPSRMAMALVRGFGLEWTGSLQELAGNVAQSIYLQHLGYTLTETLAGFVLGCALAFILGVGVALSRTIDYYCYPYIVMFQAMPKVALAPLILIWCGLGITSKIVNAALVAFFPLMVNTIAGLRSADEDRINLMRSLAATRLQVFWMLQLPNALPFIFAGLEVAMIFALIGAIVGELVGASHGLGMLIMSMTYNNDMAGQFSILLILSVLGLTLNFAVAYARRRVLFWDPSTKNGLSANTKAKGESA
ncbi:MAG: ABC transporter permease [Hyphomicrobiaceae bacterium]|nr:MAG: ABC transporter permease [Hyphomicrobiaceae bacterium]